MRCWRSKEKAWQAKLEALSFGNLQQHQELEENEYLEDDEIEYIQNKMISEIPNGPIKDEEILLD